MIDPARIHALNEPQRRLLAQRLAPHQPSMPSTDQRLVAYLLVTPGTRPDPVGLRQALGQALPDYMIPALFVPIDEWPRTPAGKIDRQALRAHARETAAWTRTRFAPPRTDLERTIADLWRELLGLDRVGVDDSFFDLGGHSLLLVRLHAKLRDALDVDLTIIDLFSHATVRALARLVRSKQRPANASAAGIDTQATRETSARERASRQRGALARRPGTNGHLTNGGDTRSSS